jgi:uncharacterized Zn-binding protein involved in type VI secretion
MRYDIRHGDSTTANGVVIASTRGDLLDGREIAYEGDQVICRTCGTTGRIVCVGTRPHETGPGGKKTALSGDWCVCKCDPPPRLIASQERSFC